MPTTDAPTSTHAIVIGGSMSGLLNARVLSDHFDRVTILERDRLPETPEFRNGVPQAKHLHALLVRGQRLMNDYFPGFDEDLRAAESQNITWGIDTQLYTIGGWTPRYDTHVKSNVVSRATLEWLVRRRVQALPNVRILSERQIDGLMTDKNAEIVTGVRVTNRATGEQESHTATLTVDASGRRSKAPQWLQSIGYDAPETTIVDAKVGYATRWYQVPEGMDVELKVMAVQPLADRGFYRGGGYMVTEGGKLVVTLMGCNGDYPPTDEAGFTAFMESILNGHLSDLVTDLEPITPIYGYRSLENQQRHYERLHHRPENFIVTGDAAMAVNPIYGHGMTLAAMEARALDKMLAKADVRSLKGFAARFQRALPRVAAGAWMMATNEDLRYPGVEGSTPTLKSRFVNWYFDQVARAMPHDQVVTTSFVMTQNLLHRPGVALGMPNIMLRVAYHNLVTRRRSSALARAEMQLRPAGCKHSQKCYRPMRPGLPSGGNTERVLTLARIMRRAVRLKTIFN